MKHVKKYNEGFESNNDNVIDGYSNEEILKKFYDNPSIRKIIQYIDADEDVNILKMSIAFLLAGDYNLVRKANDIYSDSYLSNLLITINDEKLPKTIKKELFKLGNWIVFRFLCVPVNEYTNSYITIKIHRSFINRFLYLPEGNTIADRRKLIQASKTQTGTQLSLFSPTEYISTEKLANSFKPWRDEITKKYYNFYGINFYILETVSNMISKGLNLYSKEEKDKISFSTHEGGNPLIILTYEISEKKEEISEENDYYVFKVYISNARNICFVIKINKLYSYKFFNRELDSNPWERVRSKTSSNNIIPEKTINTKEMKNLLSKIRKKRI